MTSTQLIRINKDKASFQNNIFFKTTCLSESQDFNPFSTLSVQNEIVFKTSCLSDSKDFNPVLCFFCDGVKLYKKEQIKNL